MSDFMIGMHRKFDYDKFHRDFRKDFYGIQACLFEKESDIENLSSEAKKNGFKFGIHFLLRAGISKSRDAQFLSLDDGIKKSPYSRIEDELIYMEQKWIKPEYILFHYPKPAILKENFDMKNWRFYDSSEYTYESEYSWHQFKRNSEYLFQWLSEKVLNIILLLY